MRGGSLLKLQAMLGHSSVRVTEICAHLPPEALSGATSILDGLGAAKPTEINAPSTRGAAAPTGAVEAGSYVCENARANCETAPEPRGNATEC